MVYNLFRTALPVHPQGTIATCFHRTKIENLGGIFTEGFRHGDQQMYGQGLYTCFNIESQLQPQMEQLYGDVIIEFKINLSNILNLENLNKESKTSIINQLENIFPKSKRFQEAMNKYKDLSLPETLEYTSDIAKIFYPLIIENYDGMIFNGRHDGLVCIMYNYSGNAIPFRIRDGKTGAITKVGITPEQKTEIDKMSWVSRIKQDKDYFENCPYKNDPEIEEALVQFWENYIKDNSDRHDILVDNNPTLYNKYKDRFDESLLLCWENHIMGRAIDTYATLHLDQYIEFYNNNRDRLNKALLDGWENSLRSFPDEYLKLKYNETELYTMFKNRFDKFEDACVKNFSKRIRTYNANEYKSLQSKYPEFFNKWKEQFDEDLSEYWVKAIKDNPINYISLQKNSPEIFQKYKDVFVQLFTNIYTKEIRVQLSPEKYGLKSEANTFNWHKLSSSKNIAPK